MMCSATWLEQFCQLCSITDVRLTWNSKYLRAPNEIVRKYTGLEHRQTLRACDFHCDLQIEIENEY